MAATPGYQSTLKIGANSVTLVQTADIALAAKPIDTTSIGGNGWETSILGTLGGKLSLKGNIDQTDTNGQQAIINAFMNRTQLSSVVFSPDGVKTYTFNCWVTDYQPATAATAGATFSFSILVTGAVTAA